MSIFDWQRCLPKKLLARKNAAINGLKYIGIEKELKKQTRVLEKHYQDLIKLFKSHKKEEKPVKTKKRSNKLTAIITRKSKLICDSK